MNGRGGRSRPECRPHRGFALHAVRPARALRLIAALIVFLAPASAAAQNMVVIVNQGADVGTSPIAGATVCVGTSAEPAKYGRLTTNSSGQVNFPEVPGTELLVTAHKPGFRGRSKTAPASNWSRVERIGLQPGSGGPACPAPLPTTGQAEVTITTIRSFSINDNAAEMQAGAPAQLWVEWTGAAPAQYRVSERSGFPGAAWRRWGPPRPVPGRTWRPAYQFQDQSPGEKTIYIQLRNAHGRTSAIVSDRIRLEAGADIGARRVESCQVEIHRADNALSSEPSPALREVVRIPANTERRFNSAWPSANEKRPGYGMHVRRLRNLGPYPVIVHSTIGADLRISMFVMQPNESRSVRFDLDRIGCGG